MKKFSPVLLLGLIAASSPIARAVWIDAKTGEPVHVVPLGPDGKGQVLIDPNHASYPGGKNLFWDETCKTWKDAATGKEVHVVPIGADGKGQILADPDHAFYPGGKNLFWKPCAEAATSSSTIDAKGNSTAGMAAATVMVAPFSSWFGYVGADYSGYSLRSNGSRTTDATGVEAACSTPVVPSGSLQFDGDYSRLFPGRSAPSTNAWDGDAHFIYKVGDIPLGGFTGGFSNHGASTWGGGFEGAFPFAKCPDLPPVLSSSTLDLQGFYARTSKSSTDLWGGRAEWHCYPCDDLRIRLHAGDQHSSSHVAPSFSFTDNIYDLGIGAEFRFKQTPWSVFGDFDHTHFNTSGLNVEGFSLGVRYNLGATLKGQEANGPVFPDFNQLLGVGYKF